MKSWMEFPKVVIETAKLRKELLIKMGYCMEKVKYIIRMDNCKKNVISRRENFWAFMKEYDEKGNVVIRKCYKKTATVTVSHYAEQHDLSYVFEHIDGKSKE